MHFFKRVCLLWALLFTGLLISPAQAQPDLVPEIKPDFNYEPKFDPLPLPPLEEPIRDKPSGPLDGQALECVYPLKDSFYVLSPAYYLFLEGGFQLIDELPNRRFELVGGRVEIYDTTIHLLFNTEHKWAGDRVLNRRSMIMVHRDRDSRRKVTGQCKLVKADEVMEIFGSRYFKKF